MRNIKVLSILWKDQVSLFMFTDFLKSLYLKEVPYKILSGTLYDDPEKFKETLNIGIDPEQISILIVKETKVLNMENQVLKSLMEVSDVVVSLQPGVLEDLLPLKVSPSSEGTWAPLTERWKSNLVTMAKPKPEPKL
jgi:hypothetical protein